jgi:hypothetical protein
MQSTRDRIRSGGYRRGKRWLLRYALLRFRLIPTSAVRWSIFLASRTEATGRVERARMTIAYLDTPSAFVVARHIGVSQTVTRCLERAAEWGAWQRSMNNHEPDARCSQVTYAGQKRLKRHARSHCGHRIPPFAHRVGPKDPQR